MEIKTEEYGWPAHHCCGDRCVFHRATHIWVEDFHVIVSTVGHFVPSRGESIDTVGHNRYYETMAFKTIQDRGYHEIIVSQQLSLNAPWMIDHIDYDADFFADKMHQENVYEVIGRMNLNQIIIMGQ